MIPSYFAEIFDDLSFIYEAYGCPKVSADTKASTIELWAKNCKTIGWIKFFKYKLAAFFTHHMKFHTHPPKPWHHTQELDGTIHDHPGVLIGGRAYNFPNNLKHKDSTLFVSFLTSILYSKKGFPRPSTVFVQEECRKTFAKLTKANPMEEPVDVEAIFKQKLNWSELNEIDLKLDTHPKFLEKELRRTVREIFGVGTKEEVKYTVEDRVRLCFPSTSANYLSNRLELGAVGSILMDPTLMDGLREPGGHITKISYKRTRNEEEDEIEPLTQEINTFNLEQKYTKLWVRILGRAAVEDKSTTLVGLAEALKARVITKGPPFTYTILKSLQKVMWKTLTLSRNKIFTLVGSPVTEELLEQILGEIHPGEILMSADYSDATNEIKSWASNIVADEISTALKLTRLEKKLFIASLTGHTIEIESDKAEEIKALIALSQELREAGYEVDSGEHIGSKKFGLRATQKSGQLMGSIVSFPILCICNAAMARLSIELSHNRNYKLSQTPMVVNGDDLLIKGTEQTYEIWKRVSAAIGLKESIGKTFVDTNYCNINSTSFYYNPTRKVHIDDDISHQFPNVMGDPGDFEVYRRYELIKYINMGIMKGVKRSQGKAGLVDDITGEYNLVARAKELAFLSKMDNKTWPLIRDQFLERNVRSKSHYNQIPWFLPEWIGGLGLPKEYGSPSELDLRTSHRTLLQSKQKGMPKKLTQKPDWQIRKLATQYLQKHTQSQSFRTNEVTNKDYENSLSALGVNILFDSDFSLKDLKVATSQDINDVKRILRRNAKFHKPSGPLPSPLSAEDLEERITFESYLFRTVSRRGVAGKKLFPPTDYSLSLENTQQDEPNTDTIELVQEIYKTIFHQELG